MTNLSQGLTTVDEKVAFLKQQLNMFTKEATEIEINLTSVQTTIQKAEQLVTKLSKEFKRWRLNASILYFIYRCRLFIYYTNHLKSYKVSMGNNSSLDY